MNNFNIRCNQCGSNNISFLGKYVDKYIENAIYGFHCNDCNNEEILGIMEDESYIYGKNSIKGYFDDEPLISQCDLEIELGEE